MDSQLESLFYGIKASGKTARLRGQVHVKKGPAKKEGVRLERS